MRRIIAKGEKFEREVVTRQQLIDRWTAQGETKHNDYINHAVAQGLTHVSLKTNKPVIFGVLTPNNQQQALDRAGGIHGNKGDEAAMTAIKMLGLRKTVSEFTV